MSRILFRRGDIIYTHPTGVKGCCRWWKGEGRPSPGACARAGSSGGALARQLQVSASRLHYSTPVARHQSHRSPPDNIYHFGNNMSVYAGKPCSPPRSIGVSHLRTRLARIVSSITTTTTSAAAPAILLLPLPYYKPLQSPLTTVSSLSLSSASFANTLCRK